MNAEYQRLADAAGELLAAIDRRWCGETDRKRASAISPRQEDAMDALRDILSTAQAKDD
jgi:hypothetical protein